MRRLTFLLGLPLLLTSETALAQIEARPNSNNAASIPAASIPKAKTSATASESAATVSTDDEEIVVKGQKPRGSVIGDIPPEQTLNPGDVRAYGVNNISDLLDQLAPQTTSGRGGQPVILLNGRRISSFGEIRDLPTEAIARVDILPEEVALKYGYSADQKVVNFVLRQRFLALVGQAGATTTTEGGGTSTNPEANYVRIRGDNRLTVNLRYQANAKLLESQRDIRDGQLFDLTGNVGPARGAAEIDPALSALAGQQVRIAAVPPSATSGAPALTAFLPGANNPNVTDIRRDKTLKGASQQWSGNLVYARPVFARSTLTLNGSLSHATGDSLRGLPSAAFDLPTGNPFSPFTGPVAVYRYLDSDTLHQRTSTLTGHGGLTINGDTGRWRWSVTGNYDHSDNLTRTETGIDTGPFQARLNALDPTANPFGGFSGVTTNRARSVSNTGNIQALAGGPVFKLPAGDLTANVKAGFEYTGLDASAIRAGIEQSNDLVRRNANGQVNFDLPLTSRRSGFLSWMGNLTLNANLGATSLSDFGTLTKFGGGFTWTPIPAINLIGSYTRDENAPTIMQIGDPTIATPQVRVFDYARGITVDVTQISGGNPALQADRRSVWKLGATLKPFGDKNDLTFTANFFHTITNDAIASLPEATADLEAAFPDRFRRDANGDLIQIDTRPVNFARERQDQLRLGLTFSINLKSIIQKKFEAWIAARRAGQDLPPPVPSNRFEPVLAGNKADVAKMRADAELRRQQRQQEQSGNAQPSAVAPTADNARPPGNGAGPPPAGSPSAGGFGSGGFRGGGGRGGFGGGGMRQASGRLQVAIYDTWTLRDEVLIRQGVPLLDLLNGDAVGAGGGQSEHQVQFQLGYSNNGLGIRMDGNYKTGSIVREGGFGTSGDLRFSGLTTFNLRLFADLGAMPKLIAKPWARGLRISVGVNNLFDTRQRVRDTNGETPLRYQPAYLDPLGRTVSVTIRKLIF